MAKILNKMNQRIGVDLKSGKMIDLLAKGEATISDEDLSSPHLQNLISAGVIVQIDDTPKDRQEKSKEQIEAKPEKEKKGKK